MKPYGYDARERNDFGELLDSTKTGRTPTRGKKDSRRIDKKKNRAKLRQEDYRTDTDYVMDSIDLDDME